MAIAFHRIRAGLDCIRGEATTLFLQRGDWQLFEGVVLAKKRQSAQAAQKRSGILATLDGFHER
jgi:hypothetical protein